MDLYRRITGSEFIFRNPRDGDSDSDEWTRDRPAERDRSVIIIKLRNAVCGILSASVVLVPNVLQNILWKTKVVQVNDDRTIVFGWTIPLRVSNSPCCRFSVTETWKYVRDFSWIRLRLHSSGHIWNPSTLSGLFQKFFQTSNKSSLRWYRIKFSRYSPDTTFYLHV